eukprot:EG_transcript_16640
MGDGDPGQYELLQRVAVGPLGPVYQARHVPTGLTVAVKVVDLGTQASEGEALRDDLEERLCGLQDPHLVTTHAVLLAEAELWLVTDWLAGLPARAVAARCPLAEPELALLLREALHGLASLHGRGHAHGRLTAANVFATPDGVRLTDHQLGALARPAGPATGHCTLWTAPELAVHTAENAAVAAVDPAAADIWALGIAALELAQGEPPYAALPLHEALPLLRGAPDTLTADLRRSGAASPPLLDFIAACLRPEPAQRPTAPTLLGHPFLERHPLPSNDPRPALRGLLARVADAQRQTLAEDLNPGHAAVEPTGEEEGLPAPASRSIPAGAPGPTQAALLEFLHRRWCNKVDRL